MNVDAQIERVSEALDGTQANHNSYEAAISDDGLVIAYRSSASNLLAGDDNDLPDVFVRDFDTDTLEWANVDPSDGTTINYNFYRNAFFPSVSDNGSRISYSAYPGFTILVVRDRLADTTTEYLPTSAGTSGFEREEPQLSGNGQFLAFHTQLSLSGAQPASLQPLADDQTGLAFDVFLLDIENFPNDPLERLSRPEFASDDSCAGTVPDPCPAGDGDSMSVSLSDDGARVAFYSWATNLVPDDTNNAEDVFVKVRDDGAGTPPGITGEVIRASVASDGAQADGDSYDPMLSGDGNFVAFRSLATNLVDDDGNGVWDIFVHDLQLGVTERVSVASNGAEANAGSFSPSISDDGRFVAFRSNASNLVADDSNQRFDIFVHDRDTGETRRVSLPSGGGEADNHSYLPAISGNGEWIVFESDATNLVAGDSNRARDVFRTPNPLFGVTP